MRGIASRTKEATVLGFVPSAEEREGRAAEADVVVFDGESAGDGSGHEVEECIDHPLARQRAEREEPRQGSQEGARGVERALRGRRDGAEHAIERAPHLSVLLLELPRLPTGQEHLTGPSGLLWPTGAEGVVHAKQERNLEVGRTGHQEALEEAQAVRLRRHEASDVGSLEPTRVGECPGGERLRRELKESRLHREGGQSDGRAHEGTLKIRGGLAWLWS